MELPLKGSWAENLACRWLEEQGYQLISRNQRTPYGEIDLWMYLAGVYVAVEVKQRRSHRFGTPLEAVSPQKVMRLCRSVLYLLGRDDLPVRLEVVLVEGSPHAPQIQHLVLD